jgi:hypothetical protein
MRALLLALTTCLFVVSTATAKYSGGSGTAQDPYKIATAADLIALGETPEDYDKHFILTADIDLDPNLPGRKVFDKAVIPGFTGLFDGNGHTVSHLTGCAGLFGQLDWGAEVKDLGLVDVKIAGWGPVGALAGSTGGEYTGTSTITGCYSTGTVRGTSGTSSVGGLVGDSWGAISYCYSTAAVSGGSCVGGLVGVNEYSPVRWCYSTGAVRGTESAGGLVGFNNEGHVSRCFWDTQTSGCAQSDGGTGKITSEMQDIRTYQDAGWDFVGEVNDGLHEVWRMPEEGGYPVLAVFNGYTPPQLQGQGTPENPYLITSVLELGAMAHCRTVAHYRLTAPLDLSGIRWATAVIPSFAGTFDGDGLTISHMRIDGEENLGLIGVLGPGEVKDLGVVDVNITGSGTCVGGLVGHESGYGNGRVTRCYSTGVVRGTDSVGGLVGDSWGAISHCYSTVAVSGSSSVGGLVGAGVATHSYSSGAVNGVSFVGGVVGSGLATACFWDAETGPQASGTGGTGLPTARMQDMQTYLDARWDWVGETSNGTSEIWQMPQGGGYPILAKFGGYKPPQLRGTGTPDAPYLIADPVELGAMVYGNAYAHYRLANSIDLSGIRWSVAVVPWFAGLFDGDGHTISHLTITGRDDLGVFGRLNDQAQIKDLGVVDVNITGSRYPAGGLVGSNSGGTLTNCYSTGSVSGGESSWLGGGVGGLVGVNTGGVIQCHSSSAVSGEDSVGGLVGENYGTVTRGSSAGAVTGGNWVGGLAGYNSPRGSLTQCCSASVVNGTGQGIGGLVGSNDAVRAYLGNQRYANSVTRGSVACCYSTGKVLGGDYVGGLVGQNGGDVTQCYSTGAVTGRGGMIGGLVGCPTVLSTYYLAFIGIKGNVTDCLWNKQTSGQTGSWGGTGKTTVEMQMQSTFTDAGWDFAGETANGTEDIWKIAEGLDYPRLWWEPYDGRVTVVPGQIFTVTLESNPSTGY